MIESRSTGARAGLFYDIGYVTRRIAKACESLDILVIESNHDEDMLRVRPYSPSLKRRIASRVGHLSNPRRRPVRARNGDARSLARRARAPERGEQLAGRRDDVDARRDGPHALQGHDHRGAAGCAGRSVRRRTRRAPRSRSSTVLF